MSETVKLSGLSKSYGARPVLREVSLSLWPGVTGLLGPNGAGKSTLIKVMLGLLRVGSGQGRVLGYDIARQSRAVRSVSGYMPEDDCYLAGLSGVAMVRFAARLSGLSGLEALRRSHEVLDFVGLREERYRQVQTYSTGMRQKLKFAQAIVHDPDFVILDEPTSGLDPEERALMLSRVHQLGERRGKTVLLATHILHDVQQICSRVVLLAGGELRLQADVAELRRPAEASLKLSLLGDPKPFVARLGERGIDARCDDRGDLTLPGLDAGASPLLFAIASELGVAIRSLRPGRNSLEEVFLEAVKEAR